MTQTTANRGILADAPVHPTISVTDIARARSFYVDTLGLPVKEEDDMGGLRLIAGGCELYIYQRDDPPKAENTVASFEVDELDPVMDALRGNGVVFEEYDMPGLKTDHGVFQAGPMRGCWFKDPDGNTFGLFQRS